MCHNRFHTLLVVFVFLGTASGQVPKSTPEGDSGAGQKQAATAPEEAGGQEETRGHRQP